MPRHAQRRNDELLTAPGIMRRCVRTATSGTAGRCSSAADIASSTSKRVAALRLTGYSGAGLTFGTLESLDLEHRAPLVSVTRRRTVKGQLVLLEAHFGRDFVIDDLSPHQLETYITKRKSGALTSKRHRTSDPGVRAGTIRNEIHLLRALLRWACQFKVGGKRLVAVDPLDGATIPREVNMMRPLATEARYRALLNVADRAKRTHSGHTRVRGRAAQ